MYLTIILDEIHTSLGEGMPNIVMGIYKYMYNALIIMFEAMVDNQREIDMRQNKLCLILSVISWMEISID